MKIRVVVCLKNDKHIQRIMEYYENHYEKLDHFDLHMFSEYNLAKEYIQTHNLDIFLLDTKAKCEEPVKGKFLFAYLSEEKSLDMYEGEKAICKYQKAETLFQELFSFFAESLENKQYKFSSDSAKIYLFQNAGGGSGCTTVAMACACAFAEQKKKVLYLNLEQTATLDEVFVSEGNSDFGDVIYAVKSDSDNQVVKILSCITQDKSGVFFIKPCRNILDREEITEEDMSLLISILRDSCDFEAIIIDKEFSLHRQNLEIMELADSITFVLEAKETCQKKFNQIADALLILEEQTDINFTDKTAVIFNKYNESQNIILNPGWKIKGGFPEYEHIGKRQIVQYISKMKAMKSL